MVRKRISSTIWGILWILLGIGVAGSVAGVWKLYPFFQGWWTFLLILPAVLNIIEHGIRIGNSIFLALGVALFSCCRGYLPWEVFYQLAVPMVMILIGLVIVLKNIVHFGGRRVRIPNEWRKEELVVFSGKNLVVNDEFFGMNGDAIFGGFTIDLRNATIEQDCSIEVMAVFGGIDILLPPNVSVKLNDISLFGGCTTKSHSQGTFVVYINAIALFGGVEVK